MKKRYFAFAIVTTILISAWFRYMSLSQESHPFKHYISAEVYQSASLEFTVQSFESSTDILGYELLGRHVIEDENDNDKLLFELRSGWRSRGPGGAFEAIWFKLDQPQPSNRIDLTIPNNPESPLSENVLVAMTFREHLGDHGLLPEKSRAELVVLDKKGEDFDMKLNLQLTFCQIDGEEIPFNFAKTVRFKNSKIPGR